MLQEQNKHDWQLFSVKDQLLSAIAGKYTQLLFAVPMFLSPSQY